MRKLLIANRGEIARRIQRTCRELGVDTVAVHSDVDASAPFVAEADEAVEIGGATPAESYLNVDAILEAAARTRADALHPGYGFLSENAELARRCEESGVRFVGPGADAIAAMGSKLEAKRRMSDAGVPLLPSHDAGEVAPESADLADAAEKLGYPVLVKASSGGGGRGMRVVREPDALADAIASARREAGAAFGDGRVYLERYLEPARHIEVQILGDAHGRVVHLFERECSIQRRHQKIIEESPAPGLNPELRQAIYSAAVSAGEAIGYQSAGTVEFLLGPDSDFYFLEVNTRLQVEHPVTELVTGLDLVRLQLELAEGGRLPPQADLPRPRGHAIEARIYAEDPARDYLPSTGRLERFQIESLPRLRLDSGVEDGSQVSPHYDPMLAKLIAWEPERSAAVRKLSRALARAKIHGIFTNRDLLVGVLRHPEFEAGTTDTGFLERNDPAHLAAPPSGLEGERLHALAAALAAQAGRRRNAGVLRSVPSGWRNVPSADQHVRYESRSGPLSIAYRFTRDGATARIDGEPVPELALGPCTDDQVEMSVAGVRRRFEVARYGSRTYVDSSLGASELVELPRFPEASADAAAGSLSAPMPGVVRDVRVAPGDRVAEGDVLVVIEAMKLEQPVRAPHSGTVSEVGAVVGDQVEAGRVLAVIDPDPSEDEVPVS